MLTADAEVVNRVQPPAAPGLLPPTGAGQTAAPALHTGSGAKMKDFSYPVPENSFTEREKLKGETKVYMVRV